ncbi:ImcF domain-containing protein [Caballeronia ptereochthonis]|uniref:ImcF domain-containing protein n=1 Tax=Caballeronia ptereochthonis TaxID=1777144 RepID=A0A158A962_9BURK|nr:ImcF domain-containing protein [Caballeronia ptereochthonis]
MNYLSFLRSRWFLALLALVALASAVWFFGPFVAFGGLRPLAGIAMRVSLIALLLAGVLLWLKALPTSPVFVALICLLIWCAAPFLSFGQSQPFASATARAFAIAIVLVGYGVYWLVWAFRRMQSDPHFLKQTLTLGRKQEASPAAARLQNVERQFRQALARLKAMRTGARGISRLFQGSRYLYELPWYVALGSPGSGKTSALLGSGLHVPIGETAHRTMGPPAPTQATDCWLTNEAVLIDTAGHYTRHGASMDALPARSAGDKTREGDEAAMSAQEHALAGPSGDPGWRRIVDADEWRGFLALLRRHRPRAPLNGVLLSVRLDVLTSPDPAVRTSEAVALRTRLEEVRSALGICFPVYLIITQMDRLPGFADYFSSLTKETRTQIWGFTLSLASGDPVMRCEGEFARLSARIAGGMNSRLEDEYDMTRRQRLAALPESFDALRAPLLELLSSLLLDSRYDGTQARATLRGVYFTSAAQSGEHVVAEPLTVVQRLATALGHPLKVASEPAHGSHGYFLHDLFATVILPEAHLVRPNLDRELRFRLLRLLGHALAVLLFCWLATALYVSFNNNDGYLDVIARKTDALATRVKKLYREPAPEDVPDTLAQARDLPAAPGLDLAAPDSSFRYGLYAAPAIVDVSRLTHQALQDNFLLPQIVRRIEDVIAQSIEQQDSKSAYDALRVYLMLYDREKFNARDLRAWVLDDWSRTGNAAVFGTRASMIGHLE